jgi:hypothetical protein
MSARRTLPVKKSIVWPSLAAASLLLAGCGGGEKAEAAKPAATASKKGAKEEVNPWAKDGAPGSQAEAAPKKKKRKGKGKAKQEAASPWAMEAPKPAAS